jgi:hypothetical protein
LDDALPYAPYAPPLLLLNDAAVAVEVAVEDEYERW